jgi:hypothetical protein
MYLNSDEVRSYVGINNFYSFLLANEVTDAEAVLSFYSPDGKRVLEHRVSLAHFGAQAIDVKRLFAERHVTSPHGIVAVQITPRHPRRVAYRELGRVYSNFFVFFKGKGSVAQVHPLSTLGAHNNETGEPFESSQVITTQGLASIEVLQYNPGTRDKALEYRLLDPSTNEIVARSKATIPALGTRCVRFEMKSLARVPDQLYFAVDRLPSSNSKPMLRRRYAGGIHTMSHA